MELEKNLEGEEQAEVTETVIEPEVAEAEAPATETVVETVEEAAEASAEAAEAPAEEAAEAPAAEAQETEAPQEAAVVIDATADGKPAQSKIEVARLAKQNLIERAKKLENSESWRQASQEQRALMDEWRKAGFAGKDDNDRLWEEFRASRDVFYTRREEHYVKLREQQAGALEAKRAIIDEARQLTAEVTNWVKTSDALNELMDRWKATGNAGRDNEQILWDEFNGIRSDFRKRRKQDLNERRARERECAEAKRAIVDEAKAIAASEEYTRENSDRMRQLSESYKNAGYAGKPANDELWSEFRAAQNSYWEANNASRDAQRRERAERLQETMERKNGQIEHLKDQNETLTTRLGSTLNPEKVAMIKRWIAQNEERVDEITKDVDKLKKRI